MSLRLRTSLLTASALIASGLSSATMAANITFFQFASDPDFITKPKEFVYSPSTGLTTGPGAVGSPGSMSTFSPGLLGTITGGLDGIPNTPPGIDPGPFHFVLSDLSLSLTGFAPVGSAVVGASSITQGLGAGSFTISYHPASGPDIILLTGTTASAHVTEKNTHDNASVLSGQVIYTGGILTSQFTDKGLDLKGSFSFALTGLTGVYGTTLVSGEQRLASFSADGAGTFDAAPLTGGGPLVPTPAALWSGIGLLGLLGASRLNKKRNADQA